MARAQARRRGWPSPLQRPPFPLLLYLSALVVSFSSPSEAQEVAPKPDPASEPREDLPGASEASSSDPKEASSGPSVVEQEIAAEEVQLPSEVESESSDREEEDSRDETAVAPDEEEPAETFQPSWFPEVHGFVSQGFMFSSQNNYLANTERGSFEFSEVGLNFTKQLTERFRVGMQLFMRDLGPVGNYKPQFDWYYLDYKFFDWLGIRAGRTKIPSGLYNEISDIDAARVPILLPQAIYNIENRDFLLALTGGEIYGRFPISELGALEYRAYGGTIFLDASEAADVIENLEVPYVVGGRLMWETPLDGLRMGGTYQALQAEFDVLPSEGAATDSNVLAVELPFRLWVASLEYARNDLLLATEYGRVNAQQKTNTDAPVVTQVSELFYVMGSYRVTPWFSPGAYYSLFFPDITDRTTRDSHQHDLAMTLRFDPLEYWLIKLEGHFMSGTANLDADLNGGTHPSQLTKNWGLFLLKTTGYF